MEPKLLLTYKILEKETITSNAGVGNTALHVARYLRKHGISADARGIDTAKNLKALIADRGYTHVVISAFWMATKHLAELAYEFPDVKFSVHSHSNDGFFAPDTLGITLLREALDLQRMVANLDVSANTESLKLSTEDAYGTPVRYLPNLYFIDMVKPDRPVWAGSTLRVGIFGANRLQKNQVNAAKAALVIARQLNKNAVVYLTSRPTDKNPYVRSIRETLRDVPGIELKEVGWQTWPQFRRLISFMDLLLCPSYTESFCNVVADGVVERTPVVVSSAVTWAPPYWQANSDDVNDIAHVGRSLLSDPRANYYGMRALEDWNTLALPRWKEFLGL